MLMFILLINHYIYLEDSKNDNSVQGVPVIEADNMPYRILPPPDLENNDPLIDSCTLNDEC